MTATRGYIFDYGGTLDTGGHHWGRVMWRAYQQCQVPVSEQQFREAYVHGERTLGRQPVIQPDFTFRRTLEEKLRLQLDYLRLPSSSLHQKLLDTLYTGVIAQTSHSREVLNRLHSRYPMVLVSNFYGNISVVLREFGFDGIFRQVIESAVVGVRKPDPRIFTLGVEALGLLPEEVTVVGDSMDKDILPAKAAGCHTVWFRGEGWTDDPVDERQADRVITGLEQLLDVE